MTEQTVKRYTPCTFNGLVAGVREAEYGSYVHWEDYDTLQQQLVEMKSRLDAAEKRASETVCPKYKCTPKNGGNPFIIRRGPDTWELRECEIEEVVSCNDSIFEDVYWQIADVIEPYTDREGRPGWLPASIVDSVKMLIVLLSSAEPTKADEGTWVCSRCGSNEQTRIDE